MRRSIEFAIWCGVALRHPFCQAAILVALGCSPTEIAESRFQALAQTCYEFPSPRDAGAASQNAFNAGLVRPEGCEDPSKQTENGAGGQAGAGSAGSGAGGAAAGGRAVVDDMDGLGGNIERADAGGDSGETNATRALSEACNALAAKRNFVDVTDDMAVVLALFAAPVAVGGCQNDDGEGGCHEAASTTQLDLLTPDVTERLRGGANTAADEEYECRQIAAAQRTWITIGGDETTSFLWQKVNSDYFGEALPEPPCGDSMPSEPGTVASLDATDRQCILHWVRTVSADGSGK